MKKLILLLLAVGGVYQIKAQIDYNYQINGLSVTFIITQQGQFYEVVEWDFGDGNTSQGTTETEDTVTHIYSSSGNYEVCVKGTPMPIATSDTACKFVDVFSTGINQIDKKSKIVIYPNPASSYCVVETEGSVNLIMYNVIGEVVFEKEVNTKYIVSASQLPNGVYIVKAINENGSVYSQKIIKE